MNWRRSYERPKSEPDPLPLPLPVLEPPLVVLPPYELPEFPPKEPLLDPPL